MTTTSRAPGCWHCIRRVLTKPFKRSSYKVRKTHSDPLEVEVSHRPRFNQSPSSQSSSQSQTAGRADRFSAGFPTTVSSTSSFDGATYEQEYEASLKKTEFMFYCGCDTPKSDNGRDGAGGALSFSSAYSEEAEATSDEQQQRPSVVTTPKISHSMPVFFSPRNAVPMMPRPTRERKEKPKPMRMASTRAPMFINVNPVKGRGTDTL